MYQSHQLKVERTAHYYTLGTPGPHIQNFWIVCHGYGQLASHLIQKFTEIDDGKTLILAPEGLSRFYWKGVTGEGAASWMTRYDRLDEIADYTRYLSQLYQMYRAQLDPQVKITLFGFSQGVATQCRWIMAALPEFHQLILWAGLLPEDLDYRPQRDYFASKQLYFVYGTMDQYVTPERLSWHENFQKEMDLSFTVRTFKGPHIIARPTLKALGEELNGK